MIAISEMRALPLGGRLQLIEQLWDSIAADHAAIPDSPAVVAELRARRTRFNANPSLEVPWEARRRIRSKRG